MFSFTHNHITYTIHIPGYPANLLVDHYIIMKGKGTTIPERLFPNNKTEIFFNLGDKVSGFNDNGKAPLLDNSIVSGVRSTFFNYLPPGNFFMAGLRFTLFGFNQLFKIPATHFTDKHFAAEAVWGNEMTLLHERLQEASPATTKLFLILNEWITGRLSECSLQEIIQWNKLEKKFHELPVTELLERYMGYSHKHAIQVIKNNSGLSPKNIQKIIRFNKAIQLISSNNFQDWCQVAYHTGYADQSHFIREFKSFSGYTPNEYRQLKPVEYRRHESQ